MPRKKKVKPAYYTTVRHAPMGEYIFRMPADTPLLTAKSLDTFVGYRGERKIGTTLTVIRAAEHVYMLRLYHTLLAIVEPDRVTFSQHGDRHQATREWLAKIVADNHLGSTVFRPRSGKLCIDGDAERPVEGRAYTIVQREVPAPHPTPAV